MYVVYIKYWPWNVRLPPSGCGQRYVTCFFNFILNHMCGIGEAGHLKFRVLIDTQKL